MTNGEKIKEIFPNIEYEVKDNTVLTNIDNGIWFSLDWWNAEYKAPCEDWYDIPSEEMTLEQARQAVKDLRKKLAEHLEQEPRKGHWICDGKGRSFADYHCSECGLKLALCGQDIKQRQDSGYSLFCGGCGADMRTSEENDV